MSTRTQLLSWGGYTSSDSVEDVVLDFVGDYAASYDLPGLAEAYRAAVNAALDGTTIALVGNEFYADYPAPDNATELIEAAIEGVDLTPIAQRYDRTA